MQVGGGARPPPGRATRKRPGAYLEGTCMYVCMSVTVVLTPLPYIGVTPILGWQRVGATRVGIHNASGIVYPLCVLGSHSGESLGSPLEGPLETDSWP